MKIFTRKKDLSEHMALLKKTGQITGFVPTMGALHEGHLSLIKTAKCMSDAVICSIFVNPTQFNDPKDLEKYPRPIEDDIAKLKHTECDILFAPSVQEMYPEPEDWHFEIGYLEGVLEGKSRPGHYQGVTQVVKKLFDAIKPDIAFFGQKDFQQVKVVDKLVRDFHMPIRLVMCPIIRDEDGLAMSSRNVHLSADERKQALALSKALYLTKEKFEEKSITQLKADAEEFLRQSDGVKPEYFEICDAVTLQPAVSKSESLIALVAATVGKTRLIDNLILK